MSEHKAGELVPVEIHRIKTGRFTLIGETTAHPLFMLTPVIEDPDGFNGLWNLTHVPTGAKLLNKDYADVTVLRAAATRLVEGGLDWSTLPDEPGERARFERAARRSVLGGESR